MLLVLAAVAAVVIPIMTHTSAGESGQQPPTDFVTSVEAHGDDGRTRSLSVVGADGEVDTGNITEGERLTVRGSGYDASIGIYVSFCEVPEAGERPGPCLGGIPDGAMDGDAAAANELQSAWVSNNWAWRNFATHRFLNEAEGTFEVTVHVPPPTTDVLDCTAAQCALFTRADHTAGDDRVQDLYIPIRYAAD